MKQLTEQELVDNWQRFLDIIEKHFTGERKANIIKMAEFFQDRMLLAPASSKEHYHNAYPGGYVEHMLNVYDLAMEFAELWAKHSDSVDYTIDEVAFIALFHDLGKMGDENQEFYQPQDNEWRRNNMGEIYKINEKLINMNSADRSLYLLQHFDLKLSQNEWITIKIHEGMYEESNASYLKVMSDNNVSKSHLPWLIHHADMMATRLEYEQWKTTYKIDVPTQTKPKYGKKKNLTETLTGKFAEAEVKDFNFDDLFADGKKEK